MKKPTRGKKDKSTGASSGTQNRIFNPDEMEGDEFDFEIENAHFEGEYLILEGQARWGNYTHPKMKYGPGKDGRPKKNSLFGRWFDSLKKAGLTVKDEKELEGHKILLERQEVQYGDGEPFTFPFPKKVLK